MQKEKENSFSKKFKLLNSQEYNEEIMWTSSESSEAENISHNERLCTITNKPRKRKRKHTKKAPKNVNSLNVSVVDVPKEKRENFTIKSSKQTEKTVDKIMAPSKQSKPYVATNKCDGLAETSPILSSKVPDLRKRRSLADRSPILKPKCTMAKNSPKVKKKLFTLGNTVENNNNVENSPEITKRDTSPILFNKLQRRKSESFGLKNCKSSTHSNSFNLDNNQLQHTATTLQQPVTNNNKENQQQIINKNTSVVISETPNNSSKSDEPNLDDTLAMLKNKNKKLADRVKSYFDSHFSSDTTISQCSIVESLTPKSSLKLSGEIEILNFTTQINSIINDSSTDGSNKNSFESSTAEVNEKSKKTRYKKNGLAYRLNALLKKQTANISLWKHEKFLAENSNFVIPKGEHLAFRIQKVDFKYGCFLIQAVDLNNSSFLIFINECYIQDSNIVNDMILKLYEPFRIVDFNEEYKLILNVCKFECLSFKS